MQAALAHLGTPRKPVFDAPAPRTDPPPAPPPPPPTGPSGPGSEPPAFVRKLNLVLSRNQNLRSARGRGVLARLGCNARCNVRVELLVSRATARRYRLPSRRIGSGTFTLKGGQRLVRVKLTPAAKRRLRNARAVSLSLKATWVGPRPAISRTASVRLR
jgi:hypothetical protein